MTRWTVVGADDDNAVDIEDSTEVNGSFLGFGSMLMKLILESRGC